jgi:uncharacterized protein (DUF983 family)
VGPRVKREDGTLTVESNLNQPFHPDLSPLVTGLRGSCPRCGRGHMFVGYLTVAERCEACDLDYGFADSGDGAAWFVMLIAGAVAVAGALFVEMAWQPAYWVHALVAIPLAVLLPLALLRPAKGILIAQQYRTKAEEGRI